MVIRTNYKYITMILNIALVTATLSRGIVKGFSFIISKNSKEEAHAIIYATKKEARKLAAHVLIRMTPPGFETTIQNKFDGDVIVAISTPKKIELEDEILEEQMPRYMGVKICNALGLIGINRWSQLPEKGITELDIRKIRKLGAGAVRIIRDQLEQRGYHIKSV